MIWFILIYVITLILYGITVYCDMDKGESLDHYFRKLDGWELIIIFLIPIFNTFVLIFVILSLLLKKIWNKIKYWKK